MPPVLPASSPGSSIRYRGRMRPRQGSLLVVEDDEDLRDVIVDALHARGFAVLSAADGAAALKILEIFKPDLIVLDLMMPVMDGHAFLAERAKRPEIAAIPVVVASAAPPSPELAASTWNEFVAKPFHIDVLVEAIERFCTIHEHVGR